MIIIEIAGHLGADPEVRVTANGSKVTTLRIAANIRSGDKDETVWWRVTVWGSEFDNIIKHLKKGSALIVIGEMVKSPEIYTDKEGRPQVSMNITARLLCFNPFGKSDRNAPAGGGMNQPQSASSNYSHAYTGAPQQGQGGDPSFPNSGFGSFGQGTYQGHQAEEGVEEEAPPF